MIEKALRKAGRAAHRFVDDVETTTIRINQALAARLTAAADALAQTR